MKVTYLDIISGEFKDKEPENSKILGVEFPLVFRLEGTQSGLYLEGIQHGDSFSICGYPNSSDLQQTERAVVGMRSFMAKWHSNSPYKGMKVKISIDKRVDSERHLRYSIVMEFPSLRQYPLFKGLMACRSLMEAFICSSW